MCAAGLPAGLPRRLQRLLCRNWPHRDSRHLRIPLVAVVCCRRGAGQRSGRPAGGGGKPGGCRAIGVLQFRINRKPCRLAQLRPCACGAAAQQDAETRAQAHHPCLGRALLHPAAPGPHSLSHPRSRSVTRSRSRSHCCRCRSHCCRSLSHCCLSRSLSHCCGPMQVESPTVVLGTFDPAFLALPR